MHRLKLDAQEIVNLLGSNPSSDSLDLIIETYCHDLIRRRSDGFDGVPASVCPLLSHA